MKTPIAVDSAEGQAALKRLEQNSASPATELGVSPQNSVSAPNGMTGAKLRELLDAGLGESQVRNMLAAEGVSPEAVERVVQEALALPASDAAPASGRTTAPAADVFITVYLTTQGGDRVCV